MIHKEGIKILIPILLILVILNVLVFVFFVSPIFPLIFLVCSLAVIAFLVAFFRKPDRQLITDDNIIYAPADGKVVVVETVEENEFLKEKCIQVSIFMSIWNVHINWFPISGNIVDYQYHPGRYLVARHPKSSTKNERNSILIDHPDHGRVLVRQIAGAVARRIVCYAKQDRKITQGEELGFIRFGSRVDVFLPLRFNTLVCQGDTVKGRISPIAQLK
ncbi:MAG: phosphatidylserine decarboxylase family protein [Bacteroidales bacterium]|nr:phosphatidylserine decarboxylase family protein [Bacteroidales bacterium]